MTEEDLLDTGRKILNLRKDRGVAQKSLAGLTAVTPSALSRIESGIHQPRGPVAMRIAKHLGVTVDYILDENAPYPPPAKEILENLADETEQESRSRKMSVSSREERLLLAIRKLDGERKVLLETVLQGHRNDVRFAAFLLGVAEDLPGFCPEEKKTFEARLEAASR